MIKGIIYLRVSTEEQAEKGFSLQAQREECIRRSKELKCEQVYEFCDEGISGSILERPSLLQALELLKQESIDYFISYDASRLSRNVSHQLILIDSIQKNKAKLVFTRGSFDETAEGRLQITIMAAVDEYERARLKIRTELGKRAKASQKLLTHNPNIYGYIFDKDTDTLKINEKQAEIVRFMYQLLVKEELSPSRIAEELNALDIPSMRGKKWSRVCVNRVLKNFSYTGTLYIRRYDSHDYTLNKFKKKEEKIKVTEKPKDQWVGISVPCIIDQQTWQTSQQLLDKGKRVFKNNCADEFLLSGILTCGECGASMHGKSSGKYKYYCCSKKYDLKREDRCHSQLHRAKDLDLKIWRVVQCAILDKEEIFLLINNIKKESNEMKPQAAFDGYHTLLVLEAEKEIGRIKNLYIKALINEDELDNRIDEINKKIRNLKQSVQEIKQQDSIYSINHNQDYLGQIQKWLERQSNLIKNKLLHKLIKQVIVKKDSIDIITFIPERRIEKCRVDTMSVGDVPESYISVPEQDYPNFVPNPDPFDRQ